MSHSQTQKKNQLPLAVTAKQELSERDLKEPKIDSIVQKDDALAARTYSTGLQPVSYVLIPVSFALYLYCDTHRNEEAYRKPFTRGSIIDLYRLYNVINNVTFTRLH